MVNLGVQLIVIIATYQAPGGQFAHLEKRWLSPWMPSVYDTLRRSNDLKRRFQKLAKLSTHLIADATPFLYLRLNFLLVSGITIQSNIEDFIWVKCLPNSGKFFKSAKADEPSIVRLDRLVAAKLL